MAVNGKIRSNWLILRERVGKRGFIGRCKEVLAVLKLGEARVIDTVENTGLWFSEES